MGNLPLLIYMGVLMTQLCDMGFGPCRDIVMSPASHVMLAHVAHVSWGLKHRIAHGVHGHEFMTSHHVHMTRHELMSNTPLQNTKHCVQFKNGAFNLKTGLLEKRTRDMYISAVSTWGFGPCRHETWAYCAQVDMS